MTDLTTRQVLFGPAEARGGRDPERQMPARDPLRDEVWFAEQIGKSADWCRKNRAELPHHVIGESTRYDDHCVDLYREQTFRPAGGTDPLLGSLSSQRRTRRRR